MDKFNENYDNIHFFLALLESFLRYDMRYLGVMFL
jgi:hypothetical protein